MSAGRIVALVRRPLSLTYMQRHYVEVRFRLGYECERCVEDSQHACADWRSHGGDYDEDNCDPAGFHAADRAEDAWRGDRF